MWFKLQKVQKVQLILLLSEEKEVRGNGTAQTEDTVASTAMVIFVRLVCRSEHKSKYEEQ